MTPERVEGQRAAFRRNRTALAFLFQLLPTVRLLAPVFAALIPGGAGGFVLASTAGIAVWNGLHIGAGYLVSHAVGNVNATVVALAAFGCLIAAQATLFWRVSAI